VVANLGVTSFDRADCGPGPATLDAVTRKECVVPAARPVTMQEVAGALTEHEPAGLPVTT
jgi:hypothetical protein